MKLRDFIRQHKDELRRLIRAYLKRPDFRLSSRDLGEWILNDEGLYNWAKSEGVRI